MFQQIDFSHLQLPSLSTNNQEVTSIQTAAVPKKFLMKAIEYIGIKTAALKEVYEIHTG